MLFAMGMDRISTANASDAFFVDGFGACPRLLCKPSRMMEFVRTVQMDCRAMIATAKGRDR
jgi:hypothetical protein